MRRVFSRPSFRRSSNRPATRRASTTQASPQTRPSTSTQTSAPTRQTASNQATTPSTKTASSQPSTSATNQRSDSPDKTVSAGTASKVKGSEETAAKSKAESLLGNMFSGFESLTKAGKSFEFDPQEREKAQAGLAALKKMAGEDGVLTPTDRENIIGQMDRALTQEKNKTVSSIADSKIQQAKNNRGPLRKALFPNAPLVSSVGNKKKNEALHDPQHMATARNQALGQLNQGFKDMGMPTDQPVNLGQGLNKARSLPSISLQDTNSFKDTMLMVKEKAKAMGLPEGQFKKGLPVAFLEDVLGGKPAMSLLKHQMMPFGK